MELSWLALLGLSVGLAMDAFAVAVALAFISYLLFRRMKIADPGSRERRAADFEGHGRAFADVERDARIKVDVARPAGSRGHGPA